MSERLTWPTSAGAGSARARRARHFCISWQTVAFLQHVAKKLQSVVKMLQKRYSRRLFGPRGAQTRKFRVFQAP